MNPQPHQTRAFFGRRKGHKLRPNQARLMETLLPQLAIDLSRPAPAELSKLFSVPVSEIALEIGFGGGESMVEQAQAHPRTGMIGVEPFVNGMAKALSAIESGGLQNIRLHFDDATGLIAWLPEACPVAGRLDPSRSVAEAAALEAPLRSGFDRRTIRPHLAARRRAALRDRHCRLRGLDAAAFAAIACVRLDGAMRRRLAAGVAGLHPHALPRQGRAPAAHFVFPDFPQTMTGRARGGYGLRRTCQKRTTRCAVDADSRA